MLDYKLSLKAERYFKKLKDKALKQRYYDAIIAIRTNPDIGTLKKGNLKGIFGYNVYYDGINYEIAYEVIEKDGKLILVILAGSRENFYNELSIYLQKRRGKEI